MRCFDFSTKGDGLQTRPMPLNKRDFSPRSTPSCLALGTDEFDRLLVSAALAVLLGQLNTPRRDALAQCARTRKETGDEVVVQLSVQVPSSCCLRKLTLNELVTFLGGVKLYSRERQLADQMGARKHLGRACVFGRDLSLCGSPGKPAPKHLRPVARAATR